MAKLRGRIPIIASLVVFSSLVVLVRGMLPPDSAGEPAGPGYLLSARAGLYSLDAEGAALSAILRDLEHSTSIRIQLDPALDVPVSAHLSDVTLEDLLGALAGSHALVYEQTADGLRLVSAALTSEEEPAPADAEQIKRRSEGETAMMAELGILSNSEEPLDDLLRRGRGALLLRNAVIDTRAIVAGGPDVAIPEPFAADPATAYYIVQFDHPVSAADREGLAALGVSICHYVPSSAYAVHVPAGRLEALRALAGVRHVEPFHPYFKMSGEVLAYLTQRADAKALERIEAGTYRVICFPGSDAQAALKRLGVEIAAERRSRGRSILTVQCPPSRLAELVRTEAVQWVEPRVAYQPFNDLAAQRTRVPSLKSFHPSVDGGGVIVAVTDTGIDHGHRAFAIDPALPTSTGLNTRIAYYEARAGWTADGLIGDSIGHGTHVGGTILGNGALSETVARAPGSGAPPYPAGKFAGIAPKARIVMLEDFNSFSNSEQAATAYRQGARIANNSWGSSVYAYNADSAEWDELIRDADPEADGNQEYIVFFAAGNDGNGNVNGTAGFPYTIGAPAHAKNAISVGALESARFATNLVPYSSTEESDGDWQVAWFSSRGPVSAIDRRAKPDIVAPGSYTLSAQSRETNPDAVEDPPLPNRDYRHGNVDSGTNYAFFSGTSMASPLAAGAAALIYQFYTNNYGKAPSPAMMKAILVNSARMVNRALYPLPGRQTSDGLFYSIPLPFSQGWGLLDAARALDGPRLRGSDQVIWQDQDLINPLDTGETYTYAVTVNPGEGGLKITLAWTDPPGSPGSGVPLVNDLDLTVIAPNGLGYAGNLFNTDGFSSYAISQPTNSAFGDPWNNVEVVVIPETQPGTYMIRVYAYEVAEAGQDFALAIEKGNDAVPPQSAGEKPAMALDAVQAPIVAYSGQDAAGQKQIFVKKWIGPAGDQWEIGTWKRLDERWFDLAESGRKTGISKTLEDSLDPAVAVSGERIYVAWSEADQVGGPAHIFMRAWDGSNWVEFAGSAHNNGLSGPAAYDATDPMIGVMADGSPVVAWRQPVFNPPSDYNEQIRVARWNGTNWVGLANSHNNGIPGTTRATGSPDMIMDTNRNPVIAWYEGYQDRLIRIRRWTGAAWQDLGTQGFSPQATDPSLALAPNGAIYLAWLQTPNADSRPTFEVFASRYVGGSWQAFGGSTTYPGISRTTNVPPNTPFGPAIAVAPNGDVMVAWPESESADPNPLYLRRYTGAAWVGVLDSDVFPGISRSGGKAANACLLADAYNQPVVTYDSRMSGGAFVFTYRIVSDEVAPAFEGLKNAAGGTNREVVLTWDPATDTSTTIYYRIYQSTQWWDCGVTPVCDPSDVFNHQIAVVTNLTTFTVTNLLNDRLWCFGVRAEDTNRLVDVNTVMRSAGPIGGPGDADGDCLANALEFQAGTEPCLRDTDGDGMWDGWEWTYSTNNPSHTNLLAMDPLDNGTDRVRTPAANDGDPNQLPDADLDGDGASNFEEFEWWRINTFLVSGCDALGPTNRVSPDPTQTDTDGDGIPDGWEIFNDLDPTDPSDGALDSDGDGLPNDQEYEYGTDPHNPDSDADGLGDNDEVVTYGTNPALADTDLDGLDDGFELALGSDPTDADSNNSYLGDGDTFQLGWNDPGNPHVNFNHLLVETFETSSRTNWFHDFTDGVNPHDYWHLSTAEPAPKSNSVVYITDRSTNTAYRMANDPTGTNVLATYGTGSVIQCYLRSPTINAGGRATLFVAWKEFFETEPVWDLVEIQARSGTSGWERADLPRSGRSEGWVGRVADISRFAGRTNVQIRFLFAAQNAINNHYAGWYVDDVRVYEATTIDGWVRDINGRPVVGAQVLALGRGGVTNAIHGHRYVLPGKVFGTACTADDGSYRITGLPQGRYYVKAAEASHVDEFFNGALFTAPYRFAAGLNPGVPNRDHVGAAGWINLTAAGANQACHFELERGSGRGYLGVMLSNPAGAQYDALVNNIPAMIWNGQTNGSAALVPYLTRTNTALVNPYPDWETNAVAPNMLADVAPGSHQVYAGTSLVYYAPAELAVREGEVSLVNLYTNQGQGRLYVTAADGGHYGIWIAGRDTGELTPALLAVKAGSHQVVLVPTNGAAWIAPKTAQVSLGMRANVQFSEEDITGNPGSLRILTRDVNGNAVTGATVYVDGRSLAAADVAAGQGERTPTTADKLKAGTHYVSVAKDGYALSSPRPVAISQDFLTETVFVLREADADYDGVGDSLEIDGYTNIFLYSRNDDPDADGLSNLFEFDLFRLFNVPMDIFNPDSDGDGMLDGDEVGYDGYGDRFAVSVIETNAVQGTPTVRVLFVGRYLDGIDNFGSGPVAAAIEGDRFEAATVTHPVILPMPNRAPAVTVFGGIPDTVRDRCVGVGHNKGAEIVADAIPDRVDTDGDGMWDGFEFLYGRATAAMLDPIEAALGEFDADADGFSNYMEFLGSDGIANITDWTDPTNPDTDGDGMPDGWEYTYGLDPRSAADASADPDNDGLSNYLEFSRRQTNPRLRDTDADGLPDGAEVLQYGSDPHVQDTDGDGLFDGQEVWDRNMDGVFDGGFFNFPSNHVPGDLDNDGRADGPMDWDTDGDGMPDGFEVLDAFGRPRNPALNPFDATDGDEDPDGDGLSNLQEYLVRDALIGNHPGLYDPAFLGAAWDYSTDPFNADSDGDGMPDGWEVMLGLHPMDPVPTPLGTTYVRYEELGIDGDLDRDGLFNLREFTVRFQLDAGADSNAIVGASTDPWNPDTDEDGLGDGEEDRSFRGNPVVQDTDRDGLMDGVAVPEKWGEVESAPRLPSGDPSVTNHFDLALNDLWRLVWPRSQELPHWEQVTLDPNSPLPESRWGMGATYVPVFETKTVAAEVGTRESILLDNRQLVIIGGRDGVQRFSNTWEYVVRSNTWNLSSAYLPDIGLDDGLSEFSAALLIGYYNTKSDECPCGTAEFQPYPCGGQDFGLPKSRPWDNGYQRSSFDWTYILGGWDTGHRYHFATREMPSYYYKSTDSQDPVTDEMLVATEGLNDWWWPVLTSLAPFGTMGAGATSVLSLTNTFEGYNATNAVFDPNPIGSGSSNGFYFAGVNLNTAQHAVVSATLRLSLSGSASVNDLQIFGELWRNGRSDPNYYGPTIASRLSFAQYLSAPTDFAVTVNGFTQVDLDVTSIIREMMALPNWAHDSVGFILRGENSGGQAQVFLHSTELHISYNTPFGSYDLLGFYFGGTFLRTNCEEILKAEIEFDLRSSAPSTNSMNILGELWVGGRSSPSYALVTISNRLAFGEFRSSVQTFTAIVNGMTTTSIDVTPIVMEFLEYPNWAATNMGFVVYGSGEGAQAYVVQGTTKLRVTYRPFYKIAPYWEDGSHLLVSSDMPSRRKSIVQVYDHKRDRLVAFGGLDGRRVFGDTYEGTPGWNEPNGSVVFANPSSVGNPYLVWWQRKTTAQSPGPRWGHSMVYDPISERVLLFGGFNAAHQPQNDLWAYDGVNWSRKTDFTDSQRPQPRGGAGMVFFGGEYYDRGEVGYCVYNDKPRLVLFGGTDGTRYFNDTWVYDHVGKRWILVNPVDEQSQGPAPRAFAAMVYAQNSRWAPDPEGDATYLDEVSVDRCATPSALLFGGRLGTLPTSKDTDGDLVDDGVEYALGGPAAGRDPRVNKLVDPAHPTETIPFSFLRIGSVALPPTQRGTIANLEALNYSEGDTAADYARGFDLPFQAYPLEDPSFSNTVFDTGVDAFLPGQTALWYHRDGGTNAFGPGNIWELGVPNPSSVTSAAPRYAHSGRWAYGTVLDGRYPNSVLAELYSPLFSLKLPPDNATSSNYLSSFFLVFYEWLRLADSNDVVWVEVVRPDSPAKVLTRRDGDPETRKTITLLGKRNNAYNSGGAWRRVVLPLDAAANESNLYVRFSLQSDSTGRDGGWFIDDVAILQGGALSGILTNAGFSPVPGVVVKLFGENPFGEPISSTLTKGDGSFRFGGLVGTALPLPLGNYSYGSISSMFGPFTLSDTNPVVDAGSVNVGDLVVADIALGIPTAITWPTVPGITYMIEYADELFGPWHLLSLITASDTSETYLDYSDGALRFYRVTVMNTP